MFLFFSLGKIISTAFLSEEVFLSEQKILKYRSLLSLIDGIDKGDFIFFPKLAKQSYYLKEHCVIFYIKVIVSKSFF